MIRQHPREALLERGAAGARERPREREGAVDLRERGGAEPVVREHVEAGRQLVHLERGRLSTGVGDLRGRAVSVEEVERGDRADVEGREHPVDAGDAPGLERPQHHLAAGAEARIRRAEGALVGEPHEEPARGDAHPRAAADEVAAAGDPRRVAEHGRSGRLAGVELVPGRADEERVRGVDAVEDHERAHGAHRTPGAGAGQAGRSRQACQTWRVRDARMAEQRQLLQRLVFIEYRSHECRGHHDRNASCQGDPTP